MSFIHPTTGADVTTDRYGEHFMQWMSIPEVTYNIAAVGQAGPFLRKIGTTFAVDYYTALEWASLRDGEDEGRVAV